MRGHTKLDKKRREQIRATADAKRAKRNDDNPTSAVVTPAQFKEAKKSDKSRLCGDLTQIMLHLNSIEECSARVCGWCGDTC